MRWPRLRALHDQLARDLQPLRLTAGQRGRGLAEPEVAEADLLKLPEHLPELVLLDEEADRLVDREVEHLPDVQPLDR